jgi:metal-responsive CopG/Arc/MetJ family transcriptional regulator
MPRVTVSLADSILNKVDDEAHKSGISRSEYVANAIESFVTGSNQASITLHNAELELNKSQTEVMQLKRQISKLENQIAEKDRVIESKSKDVTQAEEKLNLAYADVMQAKNETSKFEMALKGKEEEIAFLRGHIAQLVQSISQFALKPGEEEIKKRGWWQFWR